MTRLGLDVSSSRLPVITGAHWIGVGALAIGIAAGLVLPPSAYLALVALLVLLAGAAVGLVLRFDRPAVALPVLLGTAVAFPVEFRGPAGVMMGSSLPLSAAICGLWILRSWIARDVSAFDRSRVVVAATTFLALTILSFLIGQFPWFPWPGAPLPAQIVELGLFVLSICLFLVAGQHIRRLSQLQWLTWVFVIAGTFAVLVQTVPALALLGRYTSRPGSVGSVFWTWFVAITVAHALANRQLRMPVRLGLAGAAGVALYHGLFQVQSWASGWVPSLVAIGAIVIVWRPRLVFGLGLIAIPIGLALAGDIIAALLVEEQYSLYTRQEAWRVLWQIAERSPIFGTGLANYYYYSENFPILGWYVPFISHNNYQDLLVQTGLLGLLAFCWFGLEALWMALRLARHSPPGFARAYSLALFGGTVGSLASGMLGDWIIPFYYNAGVLGFRSSLLFWVFLGGGLALRRMLADSAPVRGRAPSMARAAGREYTFAPSR